MNSKVLPFVERLLEGEKVEWKKLGEVAEIIRGKRVVKRDLIEGGNYAVYQNSMEPMGYYNDFNMSAGTVFIVCAGSAGEIGYSATEAWAADDIHFFIPSANVISKYLYYYLLTQQTKLLQQVRKASIPRLPKVSLEKLSIPIPPLHVQRKLVEYLDKFTELEAELKAELEAELEARKKQYEYYREKLLTFSNIGGG